VRPHIVKPTELLPAVMMMVMMKNDAHCCYFLIIHAAKLQNLFLLPSFLTK